MTAILGISAFYHDSAAALVVDGEIVAAAQEERFSRRKHDERFPVAAIAYCLAEAGIAVERLDHVAFYDKPLTKFERLLETYLAFAPAGFRSFRRLMPAWLKEKLFLPRAMDEGLATAGLGGQFRGRYVFTDHHESHAASAFFPSPFDEAAILTLDGVGEWSTACVGVGRGNRIRLDEEIRFPHSLGLLYSAFTYYLGFKVNGGEYKVMGLAPYGKPKYRDLILEHLIDLKDDGSLRMDMRYFNYCQGLTMTSERFHRLFGSPPRTPESLLSERDADLAASVQSVAEEVMLRMARHVHERTGMKHLVLAGGVALNCVGNGRILREGPFDDIWIQPAAGDAGGSLGAAMFVWHQLLDQPRAARAANSQHDSQHGSLLGPAFGDDEIRKFLDAHGADYTRCADDEQLCQRVATLLAEEKVVGWFQGRMEFGPRALGARSILADARSPTMQSVLNRKIKFRESFRPFAPICMQEHVHEWFEMPAGQESPYMLLVAPVLQAHRTPPATDDSPLSLIDRVNQPRSSVPAITHVDYSARVQTVDARRNPLLHMLLTKFYEQTGCPMAVNTSFNVRGEPIVCTPHDAWRCFQATEMDAFVIGRNIVLRGRQENADPAATAQHLAQFPAD
ncbi:MAG: carbamoyltransferase [Pirellulales bacterium]